MNRQTEIINRCPICAKIVSIKKGFKEQKLERVQGLCWGRIGYSIGGWGSRRDFIGEFSAEVCDECFSVLKEKILEFKKTYDERRDINYEGICIYKTSKDKSKSDQMFNMQQKQLQ